MCSVLPRQIAPPSQFISIDRPPPPPPPTPDDAAAARVCPSLCVQLSESGNFTIPVRTNLIQLKSCEIKWLIWPPYGDVLCVLLCDGPLMDRTVSAVLEMSFPARK